MSILLMNLAQVSMLFMNVVCKVSNQTADWVITILRLGFNAVSAAGIWKIAIILYRLTFC